MFPPGNLTLDFCASIHIDFTITVNSLFQHADTPHKSNVMGHNGSVLPCNNFRQNHPLLCTGDTCLVEFLAQYLTM